jgi:hypothetical protein
MALRIAAQSWSNPPRITVSTSVHLPSSDVLPDASVAEADRRHEQDDLSAHDVLN